MSLRDIRCPECRKLLAMRDTDLVEIKIKGFEARITPGQVALICPKDGRERVVPISGDQLHI